MREWAVRPFSASLAVSIFFFDCFSFPFSVFQNRFQNTPNILPKIDKIGFDKNRSNAHLGIVL